MSFIVFIGLAIFCSPQKLAVMFENLVIYRGSLYRVFVE